MKRGPICPTCKRPSGWVAKERIRYVITPKGKAYLASLRAQEATV